MADNRIKLAHFSDLHLSGRRDSRGLESLDTLLSAIIDAGCGHVVITGDLFSSTDPKDWMALRDLLRDKGLYAWDKVTLIPGNHDLIDLEEEMRFYNALNPDVNGRTKRLRKKLNEFCGVFRELITGDDTVAGFPFVKVLAYEDVRVSFVMVNTVSPWNNIDNPLGARGYVSRRELEAFFDPSVKKALQDSFVIGVFHHACKVYDTDVLIDQAFEWTMELKNREKLLLTMQHLNARLMLHGHFHRFQTYTAGGIKVVNGGSFSYNPRRYSEMIITSEGMFEQRFVDIG